MDRARALGIPKARLHVVYNGIDRDRFHPADKRAARHRLGLPEDRDFVLYLGHLAEHKGVLDLVESARLLRLRHPRAMVLFVGDGPLSGRIRQLSAPQGELFGTIRGYPTVPHPDVPVWMAAADVVCLPSWGEGLPNVVREAHACGRPVVAAAVGGIPEAIHTPGLGGLVPPKAPQRLAQVLLDYLNVTTPTPDAIAALAQIPSWEDSARLLHEVLVEVVGGQR
jgi:glycosyltransferase involved in cell wall biosynthesis